MVDISPEKEYDWGTIKEGMYVKLNANNQMGYYSYKKDDSGKDISRIYLVYDYNQDKNTYSHLIGVWVDSKDFSEWESLESEQLSPSKYLKEISVTNYVNKLPSTVLKSLKNSLAIERDDADEIGENLIPYYIGPEIMEDDMAIYRIVCWIAIAVGGITLLISIIGSIISRD